MFQNGQTDGLSRAKVLNLLTNSTFFDLKSLSLSNHTNNNGRKAGHTKRLSNK